MTDNLPTPPRGPGGVSPRTAHVVVSVDAPAMKRAISEAVARAVNEASQTIRAVREWCDRTESAASGDQSEAVFQAHMELVDEVRALLPEVAS